tara:strand:- start:826 stop:1149 length:324 start_codon:yes stop_codon:yes gene_type:complete
MKKILFLILIISFLNSCKSVTDGFKLKKENNADEFLVEKKNPLVLPPNFDELPSPDSKEINQQKKKFTNFEESLNKNVSSEKNDTPQNQSSSTKEFILKNIKKNESN